MENRRLFELSPHPLNAEVYGDGSSKTLLDDMREHGFRTSKPIVITSAQSENGGNVIISGHRRFNAAQMLQLDAVPVVTSPLMSRLDIEEEVIRANNDEDTQRERTTEIRAREGMVIERIEGERAKKRQLRTAENRNLVVANLPQREDTGKARNIAAEKVGLKPRTFGDAKKVIKTIDAVRDAGFDEAAADMTEKLNTSVHGALQDAKPIMEAKKQAEREVKSQAILTTEAEQERLVNKLSAERVKQALAELSAKKKREKEAKKQARLDEIATQRKAIEMQAVIQPSSLYDVISIDPPWDYTEKGGYSPKEHDAEGNRGGVLYPTMTREEIQAIRLPLKRDAVVFLWTVQAFLPDAFALLKGWDFTHKAVITWDKEKIGLGRTIRLQCEFCLVAFKGKPFFQGSSERDIIREPRREHSRKPEAFFQFVNRATAGKKLEYFSRERREGWDVYGNDTEKF